MVLNIPNGIVKSEIIVEAATIKDEVRRVHHYVAFFETGTKQPRNVVMPKNLDIKHKINRGDAERLTQEEYDPTFYLAGIERVQASIPTIQDAIKKFRQFQQAWGSELENSYHIRLTRYGTGGSYDIKTREVIMRTTQHGDFQRANPAATPLHEITHLCIEHLVKQFGLSFSEKESLVKEIDITLFPEIFDPFNKSSETERQSKFAVLSTLPAIIQQRHSAK